MPEHNVTNADAMYYVIVLCEQFLLFPFPHNDVLLWERLDYKA